MGVCPLEKIVTSDCIAKTIVQLSIIKNGICFVSLHAFPLVVKMEFVRDICVRFGCHSGETRKHIYISKCPLVLRKSSAQLESRINMAHTKWTDGVIPKCSMRQHRSLFVEVRTPSYSKTLPTPFEGQPAIPAVLPDDPTRCLRHRKMMCHTHWNCPSSSWYRHTMECCRDRSHSPHLRHHRQRRQPRKWRLLSDPFGILNGLIA
jgi:hypothetical protein